MKKSYCYQTVTVMNSMVEELLKNNEGLIDQNKKLLGENITLMKESEHLLNENYSFKEQSKFINDVIEKCSQPDNLTELLIKIMEENKLLMERNLVWMKEIDLISQQIKTNDQQNSELAGHCEQLISEGENNMEQNMKLMAIAKQMMDSNVKLMAELERVKKERILQTQLAALKV